MLIYLNAEFSIISVSRELFVMSLLDCGYRKKAMATVC